jgi:hypothetical protein
MTMVTLAEARLFQGDPAGAETVLRRAVEILKVKLPANYPAVTTAEVRHPRRAGGLMSWAASKAVGPWV